MERFSQAKVEFTGATEPRRMIQNDGKSTDLLRIVEESTPPCRLSPILFNGHLQTLWAAIDKTGPAIYYKRRIFESNHTEFGGSFAVDFVVSKFEEVEEGLPERTVHLTEDEFDQLGSDDSTPMAVVLHGLTGGSHEVYLRHTLSPLTSDSGWAACVVNSRGCAKSQLTSGISYNACSTWDIRQTVEWLHGRFPNRPLFGIGFSLGASILTNYCGEEGAACLLRGAVVCSNPFNLEITSKILQSSVIGKEVYLRAMGSKVKELILTHRESLEKHSDLDFKAIEAMSYLYEFDREVHCKTWGYPTVYAYYRDASSADAVLAIRIPFVAIQATDDPIAVNEAIPYEEFQQNPDTVLITTSLGGHVGWIEQGGGRWQAKTVCKLLNHLVHEIDWTAVESGHNEEKVDVAGHCATYDPVRRKLYHFNHAG